METQRKPKIENKRERNLEEIPYPTFHSKWLASCKNEGMVVCTNQIEKRRNVAAMELYIKRKTFVFLHNIPYKSITEV